MSILEKMKAKYPSLNDKTKVIDLPKILSKKDYNELYNALKYPNGIIKRT